MGGATSRYTIEFADGKFTVTGSDRTMTFGDVAGAYFPPGAFPL